jgi:acetyl esterase/lipase
VLELQARDEKLSPPLTGAWLQIPATIGWHRPNVPSKYQNNYTAIDENKDAPGLDLKALEFFKKYYQPEVTSKYYAPIVWPTGFKNLPRTYLQVAGADPLRDDGLIYEAVLRENGVETRIDVYPGLPHGFQAFFPHLSSSSKAIQDTTEGFKWLLRK